MSECLNFCISFWCNLISAIIFYLSEFIGRFIGLPFKKALNVLLFEPQLFVWNRLAVLITKNDEKNHNYVYPVTALKESRIWDPHCKHGRMEDDNDVQNHDIQLWHTLQMCSQYVTYIYFWCILGKPRGLRIIKKRVPFFLNLSQFNAGYFIGVPDKRRRRNSSSSKSSRNNRSRRPSVVDNSNTSNNSNNNNNNGDDNDDDDSGVMQGYSHRRIIQHGDTGDSDVRFGVHWHGRNLRQNEILVCIRGTETLGDALTDLYAVPELRKIGKRWYYVHPGIYEAAREINNEISNTIISYINNDVLESIEEEKIDAYGEMTQVNDSINQSLNDSGEFEMIKERKYDILVTGHSLGAGICSFLGLLWTVDNPFDNIKPRVSGGGRGGPRGGSESAVGGGIGGSGGIDRKKEKITVNFCCYSFASPCIIDKKGQKWSLNLKRENGEWYGDGFVNIISVANTIDIVTRLSTKSISDCSNRVNVIKHQGYVRSWYNTQKIAQMRDTYESNDEFNAEVARNTGLNNLVESLREASKKNGGRIDAYRYDHDENKDPHDNEKGKGKVKGKGQRRQKKDKNSSSSKDENEDEIESDDEEGVSADGHNGHKADGGNKNVNTTTGVVDQFFGFGRRVGDDDHDHDHEENSDSDSDSDEDEDDDDDDGDGEDDEDQEDQDQDDDDDDGGLGIRLKMKNKKKKAKRRKNKNCNLYPCGTVIYNVPKCIYKDESLSEIYSSLNRDMVIGNAIPVLIQWYFRTLFDIFSDFKLYCICICCCLRDYGKDNVQYKIDGVSNDIPLNVFQSMVYNSGDALQAHMPGHYTHIFDKDIIDVFRMSDSFVAKIVRLLERIICCKWLLQLIVRSIIVLSRKLYYD